MCFVDLLDIHKAFFKPHSFGSLVNSTSNAVM